VIGGIALTTLRLYRAQVVATAGLLLALAIVLIADGLAVGTLRTQYLAGCRPEDCDELILQIERHLGVVGQVLPLLGLAPAMIGAFWGAPAVGRELEVGSMKLVLTQSVSRRTWITTKLVVLGALVAIGGVAVGLAVDFWLS
jgi:ABC-type transport system involved in multi-copper enzyme maturation permease subunit